MPLILVILLLVLFFGGGGVYGYGALGPAYGGGIGLIGIIIILVLLFGPYRL